MKIRIIFLFYRSWECSHSGEEVSPLLKEKKYIYFSVGSLKIIKIDKSLSMRC